MQASKWLLGVGLAALPLACGSGSSATVASRPADDAGYDAGADDASPLPSDDAAAVLPDPLPQIPVTLADCAPSPTAFGSGVFTWLAHCSNLSPAALIQLEATSVVGAAGYHADETGFDQPVIARVSKSGGAPVILVAERAEAGSGITGLVVDAQHLFFLRERIGGATQLRLAPAAGGASAAILEGPALRGLAQDAQFVYVARLDVVTGTPAQRWSLLRLDKATHAQVVLTTELVEPINLVADGENVAVSSFGVGIVLVPKAGGPLQVLAEAHARLGKVAAASDALWWVDRGAYAPAPGNSTTTLWSLARTPGAKPLAVEVLRGQAGMPCPYLDAVHIIAGRPVAASPSPAVGDSEGRLLRVAGGSTTERTSTTVDHVGSIDERVDVACDASGVYVGWTRASLE